MLATWTDLMSCLDLRLLPSPPRDPTSAPLDGSACVFEGSNQRLPHQRLFGGQLLGQFVRAASLIRPDKSVKSLHVLFVREGKSDVPLHYTVEPEHDGRSFATLTMTARQRGRTIATCMASLHSAEDGREHQSARAAVPMPGPQSRVHLDLLPWETRSVTDLDDPAAQPAEYELWMRTPGAGNVLGPALIAYATDLNVVGTALRPLDGFDHRGNGTAFTSAPTSHTVWFHRPFDTEDWLLLRHFGTVIAHGRCFGRGDVLTADGALVASFAQEALLRFHQ
ncbi:acyl-CoA thioesterase [Nocardia abscessus]|uniref:acyl-CoA thioesterase n=1 Tax=Nocardia abscessus TaxID=120957 RepID=UPI0024565A44|nr:acyl-CoA thioesterase domain-containing protein [Nocardia abscessus]